MELLNNKFLRNWIKYISIFFPRIVIALSLGNTCNKVVINCNITNMGIGNNLAVRINEKVFGANGDVFLDQELFDRSNKNNDNIYIGDESNNTFRFKWNCFKEPRYAVIYSLDRSASANKLIDAELLIYPGDSIEIKEASGRLQFSGKGANRYACIYDIYSLEHQSATNFPVQSEMIVQWFDKLDSIAGLCDRVLENYKQRIDNKTYQLLESNIVCFFQQQKNMYLRMNNAPGDIENNKYRSYIQNYKSSIWDRRTKEDFQRNKIVSHSLRYLNFLIDQYRYDSCISMGRRYNNIDCYSYITSTFTGDIREYLIFLMFDKNNSYNRDGIDLCLNLALKSGFVKDSVLRELFLDYLSKNAPNSLAFDFSLSDTNGVVKHLSDFKGKVVLLDFWFVGCGACAAIHPLIDSISSLYSQDDFQVISVCIDYSGRGNGSWKNAVKSGLYSSDKYINLFAQGKPGHLPEIATNYYIKGCPSIILVNRNGYLTKSFTDPRQDNAISLNFQIKKCL